MRAKANGKSNGSGITTAEIDGVRGRVPRDPEAKKLQPALGLRGDVRNQVDMLDRAVVNLYSLLDECGSDARRFRLLARGMTAHVRMVCDQLDGHRALDELEGAAKFALAAIRSSEANGKDYGDSAIAQAKRKLEGALED